MKSQANQHNSQAATCASELNRFQPVRIKRYLATVMLATWALVTVGSAIPVHAEAVHARSTILYMGKIRSDCEPAYSHAYAEVHGTWFGKKKWRESYESIGYNYTNGNAGTGHAHHHDGSCALSSSPASPQDDPGTNPHLPPTLGSPGTSQHLLQTWLPNDAGDQITVTWDRGNFLQVDLTELSRTNPLSSSASISGAGGLEGTVELRAWMDDTMKPHVETYLTGAFEGQQFDLVPHANGVVSLQFHNPLQWTVPGQVSTFEIEIEGSIVNDFADPSVAGGR